MAPAPPLLWRSLRVFQVYGANTDVGKTVFTTILCRAARSLWQGEQTAFLKPVSTGPQDEADDRHIAKYAPGVAQKTLLQYDQAISPHAAAKGKSVPSDGTLLAKIYDYASNLAARGPGWVFVETAGGVHSPGPSGTTQADLFMALRCPVVLVADSKLGGISLTIAAFESLRLRGYDVETVLVFRHREHDNAQYLGDYFAKLDVPVVALSRPPSRVRRDGEADAMKMEGDAMRMERYYEEVSGSKKTRRVLDHLDRRHAARIERLESLSDEAYKKIWYPFTQQKLLSKDSIVAIDSARGDFFQTLKPGTKSGVVDSNESLLQPSFDGSASWWTQGLGHGNPSLTLAAAYAAGRYGHVMFAGAIHEPALALAETLLAGMSSPSSSSPSSRLTRVFFSDNGSTGVEVAVKMGLRAARVRYGWAAAGDEEIGIIGLRGGYHGDTMGAMDCAEPSPFNEKVEWYKGKGVWLDYPSVKCVRGLWRVDVPGELRAELGEGQAFEALSDVFDIDARESRDEHKVYEAHIEGVLSHHLEKGRKFGALLMEPVVIGAGGMLLVDPLFQRALVTVIRRSPHLFSASPQPQPSNPDPAHWTGLPIIFDEVFTGLYRLGRFTASSFLGVSPDISVHAKLLTGGLVPLCTTLASESVFDAFASDDKADALLHGHSYTAHALGCQVALEATRQLRAMDAGGEWDWAKHHQGWSSGSGAAGQQQPDDVWSIWPRDLVHWISEQTAQVAGVWALGSILAIHMSAPDGVGYKSNAAVRLQERLYAGSKEREWNVHSRVLGNVLYIMGSQKTTRDDVVKIADLVQQAVLS
ncbi:PLP-dependent transferase [Whalleya microplaca]|nr:PLP-dependent transferase [Whalleya microplaca]